MTFRIDRFETSFYNGSERDYKPGETLDVLISAAFGLDSKPATLESLGKGRGFIAGNKVIRPSNYIWTSLGWAVAT